MVGLGLSLLEELELEERAEYVSYLHRSSSFLLKNSFLESLHYLLMG
jgi:hypothetical protein